MPDADGNIKGILVPELPWLHQTQASKVDTQDKGQPENVREDGSQRASHKRFSGFAPLEPQGSDIAPIPAPSKKRPRPEPN